MQGRPGRDPPAGPGTRGAQDLEGRGCQGGCRRRAAAGGRRRGGRRRRGEIARRAPATRDSARSRARDRRIRARRRARRARPPAGARYSVAPASRNHSSPHTPRPRAPLPVAHRSSPPSATPQPRPLTPHWRPNPLPSLQTSHGALLPLHRPRGRARHRHHPQARRPDARCHHAEGADCLGAPPRPHTARGGPGKPRAGSRRHSPDRGPAPAPTPPRRPPSARRPTWTRCRSP
jgi:hypothetical protein